MNPALTHKIDLEISWETVQAEEEKRCIALSKDKTFKPKGFSRPGKITPVAIRQLVGSEEIRRQALGELIQKAWETQMKDYSHSPISMPEIQLVEGGQGKAYRYEAVFEVRPEVKIPDLNQLEITKPVSEVTQGDIEKVLEKLRNHHKTWTSVDRVAAEGDQVLIDFSGKIDGKLMPNGQASDFSLELGSNQFIPGFETGLIGAKPGENRVLSLRFPEDYHNKDIAGKSAEFEVTIHEVRASVLPDLTDEFAKIMNIKAGTLEALKQELKKTIEADLKHRLDQQLKEHVMKVLAEQIEIELPEIWVREEIAHLAKEAQERFKSKMNFPTEMMTQLFGDKAKERVKMNLLAETLIQQYQLKADDVSVDHLLTELCSSYDNPETAKQWYREDRNRLAQVQRMILESKLVQAIVDQAKVTEKKVSYDEVTAV